MSIDTETILHMREVVQTKRTTFYVLECGHKGSIPSGGERFVIQPGGMVHCNQCSAAAYSRTS